MIWSQNSYKNMNGVKMAHKFINKINAGETIDDIYMVKEPVLRSTTKGDLYIAMYLCDKTGQVNSRMWQATEAIYAALPKPGFAKVQGRSEVYKDNLQIVVNSISVVTTDKVNLDDFLARTDKDITVLLKEIKEILSKVKNPQLKALVDEFLADKDFIKKFCDAPGAMKLHHSYLGGLLEHTHDVLRSAAAVLPVYPQMQVDLVLAGAFLHDIGKTEELSYDMAFSYTDSGQLIGHLVLGILMINSKVEALAKKGIKFDKATLGALSHIILTHHGKYEFGSPKLPATAEAFMVNYIDDLDAKIHQVTKAIDNEQNDSNWTAWQSALETRVYKKKIE